MSLRAAKKILEDLASERVDGNDVVGRETTKALLNLAGGLWDEFSGLHERLDRIEAAQQRLENHLDQILANR